MLTEEELAHRGVGAGPTAIQPLAWQGWRNPACVSGDSLASYPRPSASTGVEAPGVQMFMEQDTEWWATCL